MPQNYPQHDSKVGTEEESSERYSPTNSPGNILKFFDQIVVKIRDKLPPHMLLVVVMAMLIIIILMIGVSTSSHSAPTSGGVLNFTSLLFFAIACVVVLAALAIFQTSAEVQTQSTPPPREQSMGIRGVYNNLAQGVHASDPTVSSLAVSSLRSLLRNSGNAPQKDATKQELLDALMKILMEASLDDAKLKRLMAAINVLNLN